MLKKNLHFLKSFIFFFLSVSLILSVSSCTSHKENYLSFLETPAEYESSLIINGEITATFILSVEGRNEEEKPVIRLRFTSPEVLSGAEIYRIGEEIKFSYNGISLESNNIPHAWSKISDLFLPDGEISDVKVSDGKSYISVNNKQKGIPVVYILKSDGSLHRIESDITIEIESITFPQKGES